MAADPMLEISTALADIAEAMDRREKANVDAIAGVRASAAEISAPIAELLEAFEKNGKETLKAITELVAALTNGDKQPINVAAPNVTLEMPESTGWDFDIEQHPNGTLKRLVAKRMSAA